MTFGEKFKAERKKRNLTQQQTAEGLGLTRKMITLYESGQSYPGPKKHIKR